MSGDHLIRLLLKAGLPSKLAQAAQGARPWQGGPRHEAQHQGRPWQQSQVLEHPQLPRTPVQDMEVCTQRGSTAPCSWLRCSYVGVGGFPGTRESHAREENTHFPP